MSMTYLGNKKINNSSLHPDRSIFFKFACLFSCVECVSQPGIEPVPPALGMLNLSYCESLGTSLNDTVDTGSNLSFHLNLQMKECIW